MAEGTLLFNERFENEDLFKEEGGVFSGGSCNGNVLLARHIFSPPVSRLFPHIVPGNELDRRGIF